MNGFEVETSDCRQYFRRRFFLHWAGRVDSVRRGIPRARLKVMFGPMFRTGLLGPVSKNFAVTAAKSMSVARSVPYRQLRWGSEARRKGRVPSLRSSDPKSG
jgi:hypothetical protein